MEGVQSKIKTWAELIQTEQLQEALEDIRMSICVQLDSKLNKNIFKLLLYLSHTANKCDKQISEIGKTIAALTKLLCSVLIEIPDNNNYVISLYHIIRCLISFNLYNDAADICYYLQPGHVYNPQNGTMELLEKILSLWRNPINNMYLALATESLNVAIYNNLKNIIKHELEMTQIAYKNYTKYLLARISSYLDKIATMKETNLYFDDFYKYLLEYLAKTQLCLVENERHVIYSHILRIICQIVSKNIDATLIEHAVTKFNKLSNYFENLLIKDEECYQCFRQFQDICLILLTPVENFTNDNAKDMENIVCSNMKIAKKYGCSGCLKWNAFSIAEIMEPLFVYWEASVKVKKDCLLDTGILLETMNLTVYMSIFFSKQISNKCKSCLEEECTIRKDIYNAVILKCRCISLICRFPTKTLPKDLCSLARKILEQNVVSIHEMRECKCKRWTQLWSTCGTLIYNMAITSEHIYEESVHLFSLLCTCLFQFQEIGSSSKYLALKNPISTTLHRLCAIHYTNGMYREAMTVSALNALLTYDQPSTKAFYMWVNIKKKCASEKIAKLIMLDCLKNDKNKISEMNFLVDTSKYDLIQMCSREAKSLLEEKITFTNGVSTVIDEIKKLKPNNQQYAKIIHLLGHYLLVCEYDSSVLQYYKQAMSDIKQNKLDAVGLLCLEANLNFFKFVEKLHVVNKQTNIEMENAKFALYAPKLPEFRETKSPNVIPAYTMINIKTDSSLMLILQELLKKWNQLFKSDINNIINDWEPNLILCLLITAGEYSRLYRYQDCEIEAWTLAYRLASKIEDYCSIIYITGRSISLRQINYDWITTAKKYASTYKDCKDGNIIQAIGIFWISLADFYFECGKYEEAKDLLTEARNLPGISFLSNTSIYLLSLDTLIRNSNLYKDNVQHEDYGSYIVECLYAMVNLNQDLSTKKWKNQTEYLFNYDVLFTTTVNLSMRINSLLSFREISAHLVRRVKAAQSLGAVMRTAELLKSLCYIDLSRSKLDDCEVKLQGLEHMLDIETFQLSMDSKLTQTFAHLTVTPTKIIDPVRDVPQHDTSPVLGKKVFDLPTFILHTNCKCYKCCNLSYQYLVFVTTYIRAQVYALQSHIAIALDHFHGAFKIRQQLFGEKESILPENDPFDKTDVKQFSWQSRFYIIDYIQLLIDFCYFLKTNVLSRQQDARDIANLAINICCKYKLEGHPVYMSARELAIDNGFEAVIKSTGYLEYMVPQPHTIDISNYEETSTDRNVCVTPTIPNHTKKMFTVRRKKTPVVLKLTKVSMVLSDDEDDDTSSPPIVHSTKKSISRMKLIKRKILEEDLLDGASSSTNDSSSTEIKSKNCQSTDKRSTQTEMRSIRDIVTKVAPLVPDVSQNLIDLVGKSDIPATTQNIDKLLKKVEHLKVNSNLMLKRRVKDIKQLTVVDYNKNITRAMELLEELAISKKLTAIEKADVLSAEDHKTSEIHERTINKTSGISKRSTQKNINEVAINEIKTVRSRYGKLNVNNETHGVRITRSNFKKSKEKPS